MRASHCGGFSCCRAPAVGARAAVVAACGLSSGGLGLSSAGSVVVAYGLSCYMACGIFLDQGSKPCPLHWQVDSFFFLNIISFILLTLLLLFIYFWLRWVFVAARRLSLEIGRAHV